MARVGVRRKKDPPSYVATLEREEAALQEKQVRLLVLRDSGAITEERYGKRHRRLLERQAVNELVLKGMRLAAEFEADGDRPRG